jgi:hypothetical protein
MHTLLANSSLLSLFSFHQDLSQSIIYLYFLYVAFHQANYWVVLFNLRYWKCVLNEGRRYNLILGGCLSKDPIALSYTLPGGTNQPLKTMLLRDSIVL